MSNIEEDIKILTHLIKINRHRFASRRVMTIYIEDIRAIEHILSEREQDKARIKELEEELYSANKIVEEYLDGIPKQKIKDKIENLEKEYKKLEQSSDFIIADTIQPKIEVLQELLQESEDK